MYVCVSPCCFFATTIWLVKVSYSLLHSLCHWFCPLHPFAARIAFLWHICWNITLYALLMTSISWRIKSKNILWHLDSFKLLVISVIMPEYSALCFCHLNNSRTFIVQTIFMHLPCLVLFLSLPDKILYLVRVKHPFHSGTNPPFEDSNCLLCLRDSWHISL